MARSEVMVLSWERSRCPLGVREEFLPQVEKLKHLKVLENRAGGGQMDWGSVWTVLLLWRESWAVRYSFSLEEKCGGRAASETAKPGPGQAEQSGTSANHSTGISHIISIPQMLNWTAMISWHEWGPMREIPLMISLSWFICRDPTQPILSRQLILCSVEICQLNTARPKEMTVP